MHPCLTRLSLCYCHRLQEALDISLRMVLSIPLTDLMAFRKVCVGGEGGGA